MIAGADFGVFMARAAALTEAPTFKNTRVRFSFSRLDGSRLSGIREMTFSTVFQILL